MSLIDPKAILSGQARRGVPVGAIVTITISSICLAIFLGLFFVVGGGSFIVAAILSMTTLVPMMAGVLALDRLEPEPRFLLVTTFLWGAGASVVLSIVFELLGSVALMPGLGDNTDTAGAIILAPIVEETMKGLALFGLFWFRRGELNSITDGIVYAGTTALGFAAAENIEYYIGAASGGVSSLAAIFVVRGVLAPFCHPIFTAMTGLGVAFAARARNLAPRVFYPIAGLAAAMILHAAWNSSTLFGLGGLVVAILVQLGVLTGLLSAAHVDHKRTVARIQACAAQYLPTGLVTPADLAMLSSLQTRKQARAWARATHGRSGFAAMRDYQQACTRLAMLHDRVQRGTILPQAFEAQRAALLVLMRVTREAFLGTAHIAVPMMAMPGWGPPTMGMPPSGSPMTQPAWQPRPMSMPVPVAGPMPRWTGAPAPVPGQPLIYSAPPPVYPAPVPPPPYQSAAPTYPSPGYPPPVGPPATG